MHISCICNTFPPYSSQEEAFEEHCIEIDAILANAADASRVETATTVGAATEIARSQMEEIEAALALLEDMTEISVDIVAASRTSAGIPAAMPQEARLRDRIVALDERCAALERENASLRESSEFKDVLDLTSSPAALAATLLPHQGHHREPLRESLLQQSQQETKRLQGELLASAELQRDSQAALDAAYQRELFMDAQANEAHRQLQGVVSELFGLQQNPTQPQEEPLPRGVFTGTPPPLHLAPPMQQHQPYQPYHQDELLSQQAAAVFGTPGFPLRDVRQDSRLLTTVVADLAARHTHAHGVLSTEVTELRQALELALQRQSEAEALGELHLETLRELQTAFHAAQEGERKATVDNEALAGQLELLELQEDCRSHVEMLGSREVAAMSDSVSALGEKLAREQVRREGSAVELDEAQRQTAELETLCQEMLQKLSDSRGISPQRGSGALRTLGRCCGVKRGQSKLRRSLWRAWKSSKRPRLSSNRPQRATQSLLRRVGASARGTR